MKYSNKLWFTRYIVDQSAPGTSGRHGTSSVWDWDQALLHPQRIPCRWQTTFHVASFSDIMMISVLTLGALSTSLCWPHCWLPWSLPGRYQSGGASRYTRMNGSMSRSRSRSRSISRRSNRSHRVLPGWRQPPGARQDWPPAPGTDTGYTQQTTFSFVLSFTPLRQQITCACLQPIFVFSSSTQKMLT